MLNLSVDKEKLQTTMSRTFNAPLEKVFKAHIDPELLKKWWGPRKYETIIEKMDAKAGGEWRYIHILGEEKHIFYGVYKEIVPNQKITWTFNYEPIGPGHEITETVNFEEVAGKTKLTTVSNYLSIEDLEGMVNSGMEAGANESWDRLEELVEMK